MPAPTRTDLLKRFRAKIASGRPIVGGGAGTGISAKCEEAGGIDLIIIYNSGRFRMAGRGSMCGMMPYGNANQIAKDMAPEILTAVKSTPILAGVCATDPFLLLDNFLDDLKRMGIAGVQNFPTVGLIDGTFRANLEDVGITYDLEIAMVERARELELLTTPYVFDAQQATAMAKAGADIVVAHMGLTVSGTIGAKTAKTLDQAAEEIRVIAEAAHAARPDVIVLCHGGPVATPEDARRIIETVPGIDGFYGASSMERLPTEIALTAQVKAFTDIALPGGKRAAAAKAAPKRA